MLSVNCLNSVRVQVAHRPLQLPDELRIPLDKISTFRRLDFRLLGKQEIADIKRTIEQLYVSEKMSTNDIAKALGRSQSSTWKLCRRLGIELRSPNEGKALAAPWRIRTPRHPFVGMEADRCYLKGFSEGDLDVRKPSSNAVMVSSTTTHPAFTSCFRLLFRDYGPVYEYPIFEVLGYKWKVAARLDNSFTFLLPSQRKDYPTISTNHRSFLSWLAGIVDTDGSIVIERSGAYARITLLVSNQDQALLSHIKGELTNGGYHPTGPYLQAPRGKITPGWRIRYTKDQWQLSLQRADEVRSVVKLLPLRHEEKVMRKDLAMVIPPRARWDDWCSRVLTLRLAIKQKVHSYISRAQEEYKRRGWGQAI
jgi:hypothetical protein